MEDVHIEEIALDVSYQTKRSVRFETGDRSIIIALNLKSHEPQTSRLKSNPWRIHCLPSSCSLDKTLIPTGGVAQGGQCPPQPIWDGFGERHCLSSRPRSTAAAAPGAGEKLLAQANLGLK